MRMFEGRITVRSLCWWIDHLHQGAQAEQVGAPTEAGDGANTNGGEERAAAETLASVDIREMDFDHG